jgi:hypothetical protein
LDAWNSALMATPELGLDLHEWESQFASIEPDLWDDPEQALPELADLIRRMLEERGYALADPVAVEGEERELLDSYRAGRETADRVDAGDEVDPGDVAHSINSLRAIYDTVVVELSPL